MITIRSCLVLVAALAATAPLASGRPGLDASALGAAAESETRPLPPEPEPNVMQHTFNLRESVQ